MTTTRQQGLKVPSEALSSDWLSVRSGGCLGSDGERSSARERVWIDTRRAQKRLSWP
jgi:hypothetical protein